jgi:hypothetical protein
VWKLAWDFVLSFSIRAVFTLALFGGVNFLAWTYQSWGRGAWEDDPHPAQLSLLLAGVTTLVGLIGTFRRGKAEARFSLFSMAVIVAQLVVSIQLPKAHIHLPEAHVGERTLRRFPSVESFLLGGFLIALWLFPLFWQEEAWVLRSGAIVGGSQIIWGVGLELFGGRATVGPHEGSPEDPMDTV